jgi:peroxiredoxin
MRLKTSIYSVLAIIGLFFSAGTENAGLTKGCRVGDFAPEITIPDSNCAIQFSNPTKQYTLLNFWAAYDAASRVHNIQLHAKVSKMDSTRIRMYSISMDERFSVYAGTLKTDRLEGPRQLFDGQGAKSPLYKQYNLKRGFGNFLIDDKGVIVATNVRPKDLERYLN